MSSPPFREFHFRIYLTLDLLHVVELEWVAEAYGERFKSDLLRALQEEKARTNPPGNVVGEVTG